MRRSGSWQSVWDDRILEWIKENEGSGTPKKLKESGFIRVSQTHIARRCKKLAEHGLLQEIGNGAYVITEEGEAYLDEEYDAERGVYMNRDMSNEESGNGADSASDV
jgi:Mn-dependent DtxR family transcriptional regulator